ncbi:MAG: hypothetical protein M5U34_30280 [Chloroflexi bacterium]|nr:hypothetical protein [Chloroflexota bacterium]
MNRIEIARRFAAYIPVTLARQIMEVGLPEPGIPHPFAAATLFSRHFWFYTCRRSWRLTGRVARKNSTGYC